MPQRVKDSSMAENENTDCPQPKIVNQAAERLFRQHFSDPQAPRLEEIGRMAEDMLLRNRELETKIGNLTRMVKQLEAYRDRYVDLYELAPVGYVTLDEEGYVQEINLAGAELLGRGRDQIVGYPLESHVAPKDKAEFVKQVHRCCCQKQVLTIDVGLIAGTGDSIAAHPEEFPSSRSSVRPPSARLRLPTSPNASRSRK